MMDDNYLLGGRKGIGERKFNIDLSTKINLNDSGNTSYKTCSN